ncbi:MAG: DUF4272 domain-containing protein [Verrucomicrobiota bacterium]
MSNYKTMTAEEAASLIENGQTIGFSGFTPAGAAKAIPKAIADKARAEHEAGRDFKIGVVTGASTGQSLDGELALADAISWRTPYQSNKDLRRSINEGRTRFFDMHLSAMQQTIRYGFLGDFQWAVIEACDVTEDGKISSLGSLSEQCETGPLIDSIPDMFSSTNDFISSSSLRSSDVITVEYEKIYDAHWRVRDAQLNDRTIPDDIIPGIVSERHYGFNWIIGYCGQDWDEISTDT